MIECHLVESLDRPEPISKVYLPAVTRRGEVVFSTTVGGASSKYRITDVAYRAFDQRHVGREAPPGPSVLLVVEQAE